MLVDSQFQIKMFYHAHSAISRSISGVICSRAHSCINAFAYNSADYETHMLVNLLTETLSLMYYIYPMVFAVSRRTTRYYKLHLRKLIALIYCGAHVTTYVCVCRFVRMSYMGASITYDLS